MVDFAGHQTLLFLFRKVLRRKRIFATESKERKTPVFFLLGHISAWCRLFSFYLVFEFFSCWTHVEGKRSRDVSFEPATTFSSGKGRKANENVGDMPEIGGV